MRLSCVLRYASFYKRDAAGFSHINACASGGFHFLSSWVECTPVEVQGRVSPLSLLDLPPLPYMVEYIQIGVEYIQITDHCALAPESLHIQLERTG